MVVLFGKMFVFVKGDEYVPHGDVCVLYERWLCSSGCPHENVSIGCVPWGNAYVLPRNGKEMVLFPFEMALLQVLIIDGGFLNLKNNITHSSSFQETWPNPSSFT
jgi:hypothetical protein